MLGHAGVIPSTVGVVCSQGKREGTLLGFCEKLSSSVHVGLVLAAPASLHFLTAVVQDGLDARRAQV